LRDQPHRCWRDLQKEEQMSPSTCRDLPRSGNGYCCSMKSPDKLPKSSFANIVTLQ
jgi:hypothetical protein